ncbi:ASCH domain-containing protein [bacterium]|nr:ASCH domain-containing protein [bacterium]
MKELKKDQLDFWNMYLSTLAKDDIPSDPDILVMPAGNLSITDELIALYKQGKKSAGSGLLEDYQSMGDPLPKVNDFWIVLDSKESPAILLKTVKVELNKYKDLPEYIAIAEGEDDLSVESWKRLHSEFFTPFLEKWGVKNLDEATVITEFFQVVYPALNTFG